eukprot:TRINITY_DN8046_c0_g2_i1.p1 TRINITY_DN8046_c0_g2~~TRINITY_DN8046_c0_g2_i1.p1  ORF type:complete len:287 (+),score=40.11 TRINITY_DN8046_c0_g2_i1:128-988(+)
MCIRDRHMKMVWPNVGSPNSLEWKQTSNPVTATVPGAVGTEVINPSSVHAASDYAIVINGFGGLENTAQSSTSNPAFLDGIVNHGNWWYAIGTRTFHTHGGFNGIPAVSGAHIGSVDKAELWSKCPTVSLPTPPSWRILFRQTYPFAQTATLWTSYNPTPTSSSEPNFSALSELESCRDSDGQLHMKIRWPAASTPNTHEWKQTSNPVNAVSGAAVVGYEAVEINFSSQFWAGLQRSGTSSALLDGSADGQWWYAIGSSTFHTESGVTGLPASDFSTSVAELWAIC